MFHWKKKAEAIVALCERCGEVCDARCRQSALRTALRDRALAARGGLL